jgi:hypothetical protein
VAEPHTEKIGFDFLSVQVEDGFSPVYLSRFSWLEE